MGEVRVQGLRVAFREAGSGEPVLLMVHGALGSSLAWVYQLREAEDRGFRAIAVDLPGHGGSEDLEGEVGVEGYARFIEGFMDAMGLGRAIVVGHSMGGAIALTLALMSPGRVEGLVLANTGAKLKVMPEILKRLDEDYEGAIRGLIAPLAFSSRADPRLVEASIAEMLRVPRHVAIRNFRACDGFDVRHRLGEVRAPTLIIAGSEDRLTPIKWAEELHRGVAGSTLRVIDGCGHVSMLERPREFNEALVEFTSRLKP